MEAVAHVVPQSALVFIDSDVFTAAFEDARSDFCGMVITATADLALIKDCHSVFLAGNAETALPLLLAHVPRDNVVIVTDLCIHIPPTRNKYISSCRVWYLL